MFERAENNTIRPKYIGTIKNNFLRRLLCYGLSPVTLVVTILSNLIRALLWVSKEICMLLLKALVITVLFNQSLYLAFYAPLKSMIINDHSIWRAPREK